jgi:hypothetical protein
VEGEHPIRPGSLVEKVDQGEGKHKGLLKPADLSCVKTCPCPCPCPCRLLRKGKSDDIVYSKRFDLSALLTNRQRTAVVVVCLARRSLDMVMTSRGHLSSRVH